ncbi:MAG: cysteine desulfurase NifS [Candidatus Goldbacteria bacterium]|nr:cysteine desulfurase NifS [Candidatus Goldiibacteriota bacterium]
MKKYLYLDNAATTPVEPEVLKVMEPYYTEKFANPSGICSFSREIKRDIEEAREKIAEFLNCRSSEIIFTGSGSEADNMAIKGIAFANREKGRHIITSRIEHHAVLNACQYLEKSGYSVTYLPVDKYGLIDVADFKKAIKKDTILASIMLVNNEIGTIEPIKELAKVAKENGICFHTDAVQAAGKIKLDVKDIGVDLLSIAAHKFYGPKGIGMLYIKDGTKICPLIHGGRQEKNRRAGTENVPGIIGMGKAAELSGKFLSDTENSLRIKKLRDALQKKILKKIPDVIINGHPEKRADNLLNVCIKCVDGESTLIHLDFEGICASSGSACSSGMSTPSHVLLATGLSHETAQGCIRFSFGKFNDENDVKKVMDVLPQIVEKLRNTSPLRKQKAKGEKK